MILGNGSVSTGRGVNGYSLGEDVGDMKADNDPVVPEMSEAQSVSILVARTDSAKGLCCLKRAWDQA